MPWTPPSRQPGSFGRIDLGDNMPAGLRTKERKQARVECVNVRDGSDSDFRAALAHVRYSAHSESHAALSACRKSAIRDQNAPQQTALFDHLVGTQEK